MGVGACCYIGVGCFSRTQSLCESTNGIYMGDGVDCFDIDCNDAIWSCCDTTTTPPTCIQGLTEPECRAITGRFPKAPAGCPPDLDCNPSSVGACCQPGNGQCSQMQEQQCFVSGGCFMGVGVSCSEIDCDNALVSCCLPDGSCITGFLSRSSCINGFNGTPKCPQGCVGISGDPLDCSQEAFGACCKQDGSCIQTDGEGSCTAQLGVYQGDGTDCADSAISCQDDVVLRECRQKLPPEHDPGARHHTANLCALALFGYYRRPDNDDEGNTMFGKYRLVTMHETRSTQVQFGDDQCRHHAGMFGMLPNGRVALALCSRHDNRSSLSFGGFVQQPDGVDDPNGILEQGQWAGIAASANPRTGEVHVGSHAEYTGIVV